MKTGRKVLKIAGFSLIEVAIAIAVLALLLARIVEVFNRGAIALRRTQQQAAAYNLARGIMEQYSDWGRLDLLDGIADGALTNGIYSSPPLPLPVTLNNITYTPSLTISDGPILPVQIKQLDLTISWTDGVTPRSITLAALKADY